MCSSSQPKAPINPITYHPDEADSKAFDITMADEDGTVKDIDGRTKEQNYRNSGHSE